MLHLPRLHPFSLGRMLLGASSGYVIEDPCDGLFQICDAYVTLFLVFKLTIFQFSSSPWQAIFFLSLAGSWQGLWQDYFSALVAGHPTTRRMPPHYQREIQRIIGARAQDRIRKVFPTSPPQRRLTQTHVLTDGAAGKRWVARGLPHVASGQRRRRRQTAAAILNCSSSICTSNMLYTSYVI